MSLTVKYDQPTNDVIAGTSYPVNTRNEARNLGKQATVSGTLAFDASYPTGGYTLPSANFGLKAVAGVFIEDVNGYGAMFNRTTGKIQVFGAAGTEVANATSLSSLQPAYFEAKGLWA